jgi:hypothetical protein
MSSPSLGVDERLGLIVAFEGFLVAGDFGARGMAATGMGDVM